jgi:hypothetical protein
VRKLSEDRFLADLQAKDPAQAEFLTRIITAINNVARGAGVAVDGDLQPPPPVNAITVKASGEQLHVTLAHSAEVTRQIKYFVEADTSPSFTQPQIVSEGARRTHIFMLPTFGDLPPAGGSPPLNKWYLRAYAQYPGSQPSKPVVLGGLTNPTPVTLQGTTKMTLLASTGSGTASTTGQQGGAGLGRQRTSTPKAVRVGKFQASVQQVAPPVLNPAVHLLAAVASAGASTSITQSGTSTAINIAQGIFYIGDLTITCFAGSVDPGAYGTFYICHDDPNLQGGAVKYLALSSPPQIAQGYGRFYDGTITTSGSGGGSGGGQGGGGGRKVY